MAPSKRSLVLALCLSSASAFSSGPVVRNAATCTPTHSSPGRRSRTSTTQLDFSASALFNRPTTRTESYLPQVNHRHSAKDWVHNIASLPHSSILRDIKNPVLTVAGWSALVSIVHRVLSASSNHVWRSLATNMQTTATAHSFLVSSLGLLLVFRTNSAYQRFAEGRRIWERISSETRNLSRMMNLYRQDLGDDRRHRMTQLLAAFPYLLRHHIRPKCLECNGKSIPAEYRLLLPEPLIEPVETRHEGDKTNGGSTSPVVLSGGRQSQCWVDKRQLPWSLFPEAALVKCADAKNRPLWACDRIGREIASIAYNDNWTSRERLTMLGKVEKLSNAIGECERIHQTAVPLNYARHSLRSLTMWLFTLPFALVRDYGLMTGPIMGATAWLLFGVYQIGHSIEDPFQGTLRLSILAEQIRKDIINTSTDRETAYGINEEDIQDEDWSTITGNTSTSRSSRNTRPNTSTKKNKGKGLLELDEYEEPELINLVDQGRNGKNTVVLKTPQLMKEKVQNWTSDEYFP